MSDVDLQRAAAHCYTCGELSEGVAVQPVLWIVNHYAALPDEISPGGTRHFSLAQHLELLGWNVHIIRSHADGSSVKPRAVVRDGVTVTSVGGTSHGARGIPRVAGWTSFTAASQLPQATRGLPTPDIVLGSSVHLGAAWSARRLAKRHGAAFVFEVRDLWPETLIAMGTLKRDSLAARSMLAVEGSLARSCALVVSPLPGVAEYMAQYHGVPRQRFLWIPNGIDVGGRQRHPLPETQQLRLQYLGAIGNSDDVETILDAVRKVNDGSGPSCELQVIGAGPRRQALLKMAQSDPVLAECVTFPEAVPSDQVPKVMAWSNAVIIQVPDYPSLYQFGISPNKVSEYLASGRWLIMGADVPINPADGAPGAVITKPTAPALAEAIRFSAEIPQAERARRSWENIEFARERYDFQQLAQRLSDRLETLL